MLFKSSVFGFFCTVFVALSFHSGFATTSLAQKQVVPLAKLIPIQKGPYALVKKAEFFRVEQGVFELKQGQSIDLTDRKVLFTFRDFYGMGERFRKEKNISVYVSGKSYGIRPGDRIDFKDQRHLSKYFEGNEQCFLDYVSLIAPKGASAVGTFRLHCE